MALLMIVLCSSLVVCVYYLMTLFNNAKRCCDYMSTTLNVLLVF